MSEFIHRKYLKVPIKNQHYGNSQNEQTDFLIGG
jgi:hypothetical protein